MGNPTVDLSILMGSILRPILVHDVDIGMNGDLLRNELQNGFGRGYPPGHHQVPNQKPSFSNPFRIRREIPNLAVHLFEDFLDHLGIVRSIRVTLRIFFVHKFYIGHVDVHDSLQEPNHLNRFISRAVIDDGEVEAHLNRFRKGGDDLRSVVSRRNEVDIMAPHLLEFDHGPCHIERGDLLPPALMADIVVLTEDTTEVTVGQEDGP